MKKLIFCFFFFSTFVCEICVQILLTQCQICYVNPETPEFKSCIRNKCIETGRGTKGETYCRKYAQIQLTEDECFDECCQNEKSFSVSSLDKCKENDTQSVIMIACFSSVFGICALCKICSLCLRACGNECSCDCCQSQQCGNCCQCSSNCDLSCCQDCAECCCFYLKCECCKKENTEAEKKQSEEEISVASNNYRWIKVKKQIERFDNLCTICLSNEVNTVTNCGHLFHLQCLVKWLEKNNLCPLCIKKDLKFLKCYCQRCYSSTIKIHLNTFRFTSELASKQMICSQC